MRYSELSRAQIRAQQKYQKYLDYGFKIIDQCNYFPNHDASQDDYMEQLIITPWSYNGQRVDAYVDGDTFKPEAKQNIQLMVAGIPGQTYKEINGRLKLKEGYLEDKTAGKIMDLDAAEAAIQDLAVTGWDIFHVPMFEEYMEIESYLNGFRGQPMPTESDYFNDELVAYGDILMSPRIMVCGKITRIEDLHIACESAPDFNGGRGGNGVIISPKLKEYLSYGNYR